MGLLEKQKKMKKGFYVIAFCLAPLFLGEAVEALSKEDPSSLYLRALLHERVGELEEAFVDYETLIRTDPESHFLHRTVALLAIRLGRYKRALESALKVIELEPKTADSHILLGRVHLARGDRYGAERAFDQALALAPDNFEALLYSAHLKVILDPSKGIALYEEFLKENPGNFEAYARLGEIYKRMGNYDQAIESWKKILEIIPNDLKATYSVAELYDLQKKFDEAISAYEAYRFLDPENVSVLIRLGELYYKKGNSESAEEAFSSVDKVTPNDPIVEFWLAILAEERKDWDRAVSYMVRVEKVNRKPSVVLRLAYYYSQNNQGKAAIKSLKGLLKDEPHNPDYLYYLALGYEDIDKHKKAVRYFRQVLQIDEKRSEAHFHLAINLDMIKKFKEAVPHLKRTIELNPTHAIALNYLGYSWADRNKNLEEALELVKKALILDPNNSAYLDSLGWVYFRIGRLKEAEIALKKSALKANDPLVWEHLGDVLQSLGRNDEAMKAWKEGLAIDPKNKALKKKLKSKKATLSVVPHSDPRKLLKRVEGNFRQINSLAGFMRLGGEEGKKRFHVKGMFYYSRPQLFRMEFLGPFFVPEVLMVRNQSGLQWLPPDRSLGDDQTSAHWLDVFGRFLSGELFETFDSPDVRVEHRNGRVTYYSKWGQLQIDDKKKVLTNLLWKASPDLHLPLLSFNFEDYKMEEGLWLPSVVGCEIPEAQLKFSLNLKKMRVNPPLESVLFELPKQ